MTISEKQEAETLESCPFCGGEGKWQHDSGSYGYTPPRVWIACENSIFPRNTCAATTRHFAEEEWEQGKGTYSVRGVARKQAVTAWNTRTPKQTEPLADEVTIESLTNRVRELEGALEPFVASAGHTLTFLRSREKMHQQGIELYTEEVRKARTALKGVGGESK